jgi:hypothetical protein
MTGLRALYHLVRADFLERVRRPSFLITLAVTLWLGYLFVPPADAGYVSGLLPHDRRTQVDWYLRGAYNSAWVGSTVALLTSVLLSLPGFYLVKNAVERDRRAGVGEVLAATPLRKPLYTLGKWLSNLALLGTMVGALAASALAMQLIRGEVVPIDPWPLLSPFLLIALPTLAFFAALAVLFETIPWLRGGVGNVVFFFLWTAAVVAAGVDLFGVNELMTQVQAAAQAAYPSHPIWISFGINPLEGPLETFHWEGVRWTLPLVCQRLLWAAAAAGLALAAALPFDRFDGARRGDSRRGKPVRRADEGQRVRSTEDMPGSMASLPPVRTGFRFWRLFVAELRLTRKVMPWWWFVVASGLILTGLFCPVDGSRRTILPLAWIWPLLIWSQLGAREVGHGTEGMVFSTASPLRRQFLAAWLAGVSVSLITGAGTAARLTLAHRWSELLAWGIGAAFIPSLALALGEWSGSSVPFEAAHTAIWYVGPMNGLSALDYMGALSESVAAGVYWCYLLAALVLVVLAALGRWRRIRG